MDLISFGVIVVLVLNIVLGYFIFRNDRKSIVNKSYIYVIATILLWGIGMLMYRSATPETVIWMVKILYVFATFTGPSFFLFSFIFPEGSRPPKKHIVIVTLSSIVLTYLTLFTDKIIIDAVVVDEGENVIHFGSLYYLYVMYFFYFFFYAFINLFLKIRKFEGLRRLQVKYVFTGYFLSSNLAFATNLTLPWFGYFDLNWLGQILTVFMVGFTTYAIVKYRLLNIKLVITRSILYTVLVAAVASFFALSVVVVGEIIGGNTQVSKIATYLFASVIVVTVLDPVKRTLAKLTDKIFYKDKVDYQAVLREAGLVAAREIDLEKLLGRVAEMVKTKLKIKKVTVLIPEGESFDFIENSNSERKKYEADASYIEFLRKRERLTIVEELNREIDDLDSNSQQFIKVDKFIRASQDNDVEMIIPVTDEKGLSAVFLLSSKQSGDLYGDEDVNFFDVLIPQVATAIEKSRLYEEVQEFNIELQAKVDERTKSLQAANIALEDRNKYLTTMQVVTNLVNRTLDLKKVYQLIADAIGTELGYIGGLLSFVDNESKTLRFAAITNTSQTQKVFDMLPKDPKAYESKLELDYNLSTQTVLQGKINFSEKISEFLSPPVEEKTMDKVQDFLGVKTVVGVPIFSEARAIGIVRYFLDKEKRKITPLDIEIMTSLANQIGIVSRNLSLYNNLQKANREMQDANMRLRELDKAKSEFLSIASHQLRTPISAIKGYLSMMLDGDFGDVPEKLKKVISDIFESSSRLARLINIFLNVSRIESGRLKLEKKPLQITKMIDSVMNELANQAAQKNIDLTFDRPVKEPPLVFADEDKLREVILNLVDNAIKYTQEGSIKVSLSFDDKELTFKSTDTGIGIDPNEVKSLFRKFVRGSGVAQIHTGGSGLGLFIAQKIINEHNGKIWAESDGKGKGSTFQFVIPLYDGSEPRTEGGTD